MAKLILMSVLIASVAIPLFAARDPDPRRGLKRAWFGAVAFNILYVILLLFVYTRL